MFYSVITTIQKPTECVEQLVSRLSQLGGRLIVAGDKKGPPDFESTAGQGSAQDWPVEFLSLDDQNNRGFNITEKLPVGHYARKNVAYLTAMRAGAECIYETDDDNAPNANWRLREQLVAHVRSVQSDNGWVNVYKYFSDENIWPRGLPLNEIQTELPSTDTLSNVEAPIQQGLVNGSPDVDAIWRLVMDRPFDFRNDDSVYLPPGAWCPFNTQSTWWWPLAFPLLYIPSYCSFRMCDIWKSFIAQRCLWAMGKGIVFHAPEVDQDRNEHDLQRDFDDEVPGYTQNRMIAEILDGLKLDSSPEAVASNLVCCYEALIEREIFPAKEMELVLAWVKDWKSGN